MLGLDLLKLTAMRLSVFGFHLNRAPQDLDFSSWLSSAGHARKISALASVEVPFDKRLQYMTPGLQDPLYIPIHSSFWHLTMNP